MRAYANRMLRLHRGVWLLLANSVGTTLGLAIVLLIYNLYLVALGYHEDFIGTFTAVSALAMSVGALAAIPLSRRLGHGWCLLLASIAVVVSCLGLGVAATPAPILLWGALNGFAAGQLLVPGGPLLIDLVSPEDRQHRRSDRQVIALFATITFLWALGIGFVLPFLNVYLVDRLGGTTADVGLIFALNSAAMVVASPLAPGLARRLGVVTAIAGARGLAVLTMLGMVVAPRLIPASILFVVRGGFVALTWPLDANLGLELTSPRQGATMSSVKNIAFNVGWAISSLIGGQIIFRFGYPAAFVVAAATTAIATGAQYRLFRRDDPHPGLRGVRFGHGILSGDGH